MNNNNLPENNSDEITSISEKIKAIKKSVNNNNNASKILEEIPPKNDNIGTSDDWETEMSRRISERINRLKNNKEEILEVLADNPPNKTEQVKNDNDKLLEILADSSSPKIEPEPIIPEPELNPEPEPVIPEPVISEPAKTVAEVQNIPEVLPQPEKKKKKKKKKKSFFKAFKESFLGLFPQREDNILEKCRKVVFLTSIGAIVVCGWIVLDYYIDTSTTQNAYEQLMLDYNEDSQSDNNDEVENSTDDNKRTYLMMSNAEALYNINSDVVGVINIPDTDVFYPVVKGKDNEEYLTKTVTGEEARAGSIFIDYRNIFDEVKDGVMQKSSDNIIVYGHEMATGKMFGSLKLYKENTYYYEQHPIIEFNSNYYCYKYKIFAVFIANANDTTDTRYEYWNALNFSDEEEFYDFVNEAKRRTIVLNDVDVKYGDSLLTLSTCNEIFGKSAGGRLVIMARRVRDGEDPLEGTQNSSTNPNIKWPSLYYNYNPNEKYDEEDFVPYG